MSSMTGSTGYKGASGSSSGKMHTGKNFKESIPEGYDVSRLQQMTPQQIQLLNQRMEDVGPDSYLAKLAGGDQSMFEEMERPAMRQFQGLQSQMASQFSGMGMGSRHGSGFQNSMTQAGSDFAQDLASKRMELRNQAIRDLMGMSNQLMNQRPYETSLAEKPVSAWQDIGGRFAAAVPAAVASAFGAPGGAGESMNQAMTSSSQARGGVSSGQGFSKTNYGGSAAVGRR